MDKQLTNSDINVLVESLRVIKRTSQLKLAVEVGDLVINSIYGGDYSVLKRKGRDHDGYRKLARHPRMPFSKSTIWRYVRVSELVSRLPWVVDTGNLTVAHVSTVFGADLRKQSNLLRMASKRNWAVKDLIANMENREPVRTHPAMSIAHRLAMIRMTSKLGSSNDLNEEERKVFRRVVCNTKAWCDLALTWVEEGYHNAEG